MKDINFLINEKRMEQEGLEPQKKGASTAKVFMMVLVVTLGVAVLFIPGVYMRVLERQIAAVENSLTDAKYTEVTNVKRQVEQIVTAVNSKKSIIKDIDNKSVPASQVMLMLQQAIPSGCFYSSVDYNGSSLKIAGKAENSLVVAELMGNLDRLYSLNRKTENIQIDQPGEPVEYRIEYMVSAKGGK